MTRITDKTVKSKYPPKQTNVTWIDTSQKPAVTKSYIDGAWVVIGGGGGTKKYSDLEEKPLINGVELDGNKTSQDLGVYSKPSSGIPQSDLAQSVQTSLGKADTAYQKPLSGIPESDLSSDVQQALQKHFKGWLESTSDLPANPVVGDYAYVKDNGTTYIYRCTTDGEWPATSTEEKEPADVTFAGGEEVNETYIDDTHLVNPKSGALPTAKDVLQLKAKLEGVTASETKIGYVDDSLITGHYVGEGGSTNGTSSSYDCATFDVGGYKHIRFLGMEISSSQYSRGYAFYDLNGDYIIGSYKKYDVASDATARTKEYVVEIPDGAKYFKTNVRVGTWITTDNFYCYLGTGDNVIDIVNELVAPAIASVDSKVDKSYSTKNIYTDANKSLGRYLSSDGSTPQSNNYDVTDYIAILPQTQYVFSWNSALDKLFSTGYLQFYDSTKTLLSGGISNSSINVESARQRNYFVFTSPENTAYLRTTIRKTAKEVQLEVGSAPTFYVENTSIAGYQQYLYQMVDDNANKTAGKLDVKIGKNLYTGLGNTSGYLNNDGTEKVNGSYFITDYIPVKGEIEYKASCGNKTRLVESASMYGAFYDSGKNLITADGVTNPFGMYNLETITTPENCAYIRLTIKTDRTEIQVEEGNSRTLYEPYTEIGGYRPSIKEHQVNFGNLDEDVQSMFGDSIVKLDSFRSEGTLESNATYRDNSNKQSVRKNILYSAVLDGTIDSNGVIVGVGATDQSYHGYKVTLTATTINIKRLDTDGNGTTVNHGLTLTNRTTLTIETEILSKEELNTGSAVDAGVSRLTVKVSTSLGEEYIYTELNKWGYGQLFITNLCAASIGYTLTFFPKDLNCNIWVFGDSYCEFDYRNRLPYFLWKNGYTNFLLNAHGGIDQDGSLVELNNLLALGKKPTFIVWLVGQNDGNDTYSDDTYTVNATAKTKLDQFITLCESKNITPILQTTPSVSGNGSDNAQRRHHGLCNYVRSLGYRFIDVESAVGAQPDGTWNAGLLSSDGIHPTVAGSYVIMRQVLADFPEIAID